MSRIDKLKAKINDPTKDFTFDEAKILMNHFNFKLTNKGRSSGSRVQFQRGDVKIDLHKPHPRNTLKAYQIRDLKEGLKKAGIRL